MGRTEELASPLVEISTSPEPSELARADKTLRGAQVFTSVRGRPTYGTNDADGKKGNYTRTHTEGEQTKTDSCARGEGGQRAESAFVAASRCRGGDEEETKQSKEKREPKRRQRTLSHPPKVESTPRAAAPKPESWTRGEREPTKGKSRIE